MESMNSNQFCLEKRSMNEDNDPQKEPRSIDGGRSQKRNWNKTLIETCPAPYVRESVLEEIQERYSIQNNYELIALDYGDTGLCQPGG